MNDCLQLFRNKWLEKPRIVLGVMTGTSFDGIDLAIAKIGMVKGKLLFEVLDHTMTEYPVELQEYFSTITKTNQTALSDLSTFNFLHPKVVGASITKFLAENTFTNTIDAIGYHGQTIWHQPSPIEKGTFSSASTLQLGSGSVLAQITGLPVVNEFRYADVFFGGQGAPLVPIFDRDVFFNPHNEVVLVNIGGISNISILNPSTDDVIAYDVGPGNVWLDYICKKYFDKDFDTNGEFASTGIVSNSLWFKLLEIEFINLPYPKSTGRELFSPQLLNEIISSLEYISPSDILHTLAKFTAYCISKEIELNTIFNTVVYVSGGGLHNSVIQKYLREFLQNAQFSTTEQKGIPSDAKEALCFAYLAWRILGGMPIAIPSITGAKKETISGTIAFPS